MMTRHVRSACPTIGTKQFIFIADCMVLTTERAEADERWLNRRRSVRQAFNGDVFLDVPSAFCRTRNVGRLAVGVDRYL